MNGDNGGYHGDYNGNLETIRHQKNRMVITAIWCGFWTEIGTETGWFLVEFRVETIKVLRDTFSGEDRGVSWFCSICSFQIRIASKILFDICKHIHRQLGIQPSTVCFPQPIGLGQDRVIPPQWPIVTMDIHPNITGTFQPDMLK